MVSREQLLKDAKKVYAKRHPGEQLPDELLESYAQDIPTTYLQGDPTNEHLRCTRITRNLRTSARRNNDADFMEAADCIDAVREALESIVRQGN